MFEKNNKSIVAMEMEYMGIAVGNVVFFTTKYDGKRNRATGIVKAISGNVVTVSKLPSRMEVTTEYTNSVTPWGMYGWPVEKYNEWAKGNSFLTDDEDWYVTEADMVDIPSSK
ncbi:hypothetical protein EQG49_11550 [Periweissella cryptocerci]|uniref:Uncharacterized protein n=1 Tax=Periweissella cryptocerci TaxID=2506420 RepID=A0A4P6YW81_9LACO|nr:hypothetical protein [Periweissella cryptocerci]QBO37041.1 hypothetical protein EQG49_11550 [Periweissella cryptocerci]